MAGIKILLLIMMYACTANGRQEEDALLRHTDAALEDDMSWQQLEAFRKHPLSLNKADAAALTSLGLLTALQITQFIEYRKQLGKLLSIYELQAIPGFDEATIQAILPYVKVADEYTLETGTHTTLIRNKPLYTLLRYRYQQTGKLSTGVLIKKSADQTFYSAHFFIQKYKWIKALALGDFTINMGQGLINWQALATGKGGIITHIKREGEIVRPYSSAGADTALFYRGAGITLQKGHWEGTAFITRQYKGLNLSYICEQGHVNFNWLQQAKSIDYAMTIRNYHLFGEIALSGNQHRAMIMGVLTTVSNVADIALFYRKYDTKYQPIHPDAMGENSRPVNEQGCYTGISLHPVKKIQLDLYADVFHFPWLQYRTTAPSDGQEVLAAITYTPAKDTKLYLRYQYLEKYQQSGKEQFIPPLMQVIKKNYRCQLNMSLSKKCTWKSRVEVNNWIDEMGSQYGGLFQQELVWQLSKWPLRITLSYSKCSTSGTDTRFYLLDRSVLYNINLSQLYGKGVQQSCTFRWKQGKHWQAWAKIEQQFRQEEKTITGTNKTSLTFQILYTT